MWDVAKILRHRDVRLTSERYGHFCAESAKKAIGRLERVLDLGGRDEGDAAPARAEEKA